MGLRGAELGDCAVLVILGYACTEMANSLLGTYTSILQLFDANRIVWVVWGLRYASIGHNVIR